jgi:hypothetical protein
VADKNDEVMSAVIAGLIGLAALAVQYLATSRGAQIEARARWERLKAWFEAARDAERVGQRFSEWAFHQEASAVLDRANEITREASE